MSFELPARAPHHDVRILSAALSAVGCAYLLQIPSPLRLSTDSIILLTMGASVADGAGVYAAGVGSHYPPGYPLLVGTLDLLGVACSASFIALNCILLASGLVAAYALLRTSFGLARPAALLICLLSLLSYVLVKHVTQPLTDVPYFGASLAALALMDRARRCGGAARAWGWLALGVGAAAAAVSLRSIGIALLPALVWAVAARHLDVAALRRVLRPRNAAVVGSALAVAGALGWAVVTSTYYSEASAVYGRSGGPLAIVSIVAFRLRELGELTLNVPANRVPGALTFVHYAAGAFVTLGAVYGAVTRRRPVGVADVYLGVYAAILFAWPYYDARFWLPVVPLLFGTLAESALRITSVAPIRLAFAALLAWFVVAGVVALGYSSRITYAGARFPDTYGDGSLTPTYRVAYGGSRTGRIDEHALAALMRYGP